MRTIGKIEKYFKAMDYYIDLKIEYATLDLEDLSNRGAYKALENAKYEMEVAFMLILRDKENCK